MLIRVLYAAVLCFAVCSFAHGQTNAGALKGTVTDQLGSLVVGAKVTVRNSRGVATSATTSSAGVYEFKRLDPGTYELTIVAPGFSVFQEKSVQIKPRE
ncbi:MAG TPA: carboxypeptidase-like regulatory domain-containing protein, partial [Pyrinomonadaceae bacterium]|nr:carboxypeptidase-like regulatory domain-containing protein [Pyrinomonadaceae bacterium]